jgi:hypothetical protein
MANRTVHHVRTPPGSTDAQTPTTTTTEAVSNQPIPVPQDPLLQDLLTASSDPTVDLELYLIGRDSPATHQEVLGQCRTGRHTARTMHWYATSRRAGASQQDLVAVQSDKGSGFIEYGQARIRNEPPETIAVLLQAGYHTELRRYVNALAYGITVKDISQALASGMTLRHYANSQQAGVDHVTVLSRCIAGRDMATYSRALVLGATPNQADQLASLGISIAILNRADQASVTFDELASAHQSTTQMPAYLRIRESSSDHFTALEQLGS